MKRSRPVIFRSAIAVGAVSGLAVTAATLSAGGATAAATPGWRAVYSHHYGTASTYSGYTNLAVAGPTDVWALGANNIAGLPAPGSPVAVHWNGTKWSAISMPAGVTGEIAASSVIKSSDIWAITDGGGYILHWNGSKWLLAKHLSGTQALLTGIVALNDKDVWVFGSTPVGRGYGTWHYDGQHWTQATTLPAAVTAATATSPSNIWGIGNGALGPFQTVDHYDGSSWRDVTPASLATAAKNNQLLFGSAYAESSTSTWITATTPAGARLWHVVSGKWVGERLPWAADELGLPQRDGNGGIWLTATANSGGPVWIWHRALKGAWSRIAFLPGPGGGVNPLIETFDYYAIPKTTSFWAAGALFAKGRANATATVWAYGTLP